MSLKVNVPFKAFFMAKTRLYSLIILTSLVFLCPLGRKIHAWDAQKDVRIDIVYGTFGDMAYDQRDQKLYLYLQQYNSPLAPYAFHIVKEADRLGIDYKLVPAIAGVESTFGKRLPRDSYNAWGWAIYSGKTSGAYFHSWEHAITVISEGLRYAYIDRGAVTVPQIGHIYASSSAWPDSTMYFLNDMEKFGL